MVDIHTRHDRVTTDELEEAKRYRVEIEWSPEDEAFIARVPEAPGVVTHGATREEAAAQAEDAIITWLTAHHDANLPIPPPATTKRDSPETSAAPEYSSEDIRRVRRKLDVSQHVFASMLNVSRGAVRSWEQGIRKPEGAAMRLIHIAETHPDILMEWITPGRTSERS
jgi:putative transcriptional regulator